MIEFLVLSSVVLASVKDCSYKLLQLGIMRIIPTASHKAFPEKSKYLISVLSGLSDQLLVVCRFEIVVQ